ncbi:MAG: homoserine kinase [Woeseiaceae bacterium]|nr:homoserine kinase [Woeseiaceae bacterium]
MTSDSATAFAPASIGNVGVGFDVLGLAISGAGDRVTVQRREAVGIEVRSICTPTGDDVPDLSKDAGKNTASIAAASLWQSQKAPGGLIIDIEKGVPLQSGMGSSAASAVAATVAANALLEEPLSFAALLDHAIEGEAFASGGRHADNVAPSLLGGLVVCPPGIDAVRLETHSTVSSVLVHPELRVNTAESRAGLSDTVTREQWIRQQGLLAAFVTAVFMGNIPLMRHSLKDLIIEPQRAGSVPCFAAVKQAALDSGAIGCSLSGSGPSIFALIENERAETVASVMVEACRAEGIDCQRWISPLSSPGAVLED